MIRRLEIKPRYIKGEGPWEVELEGKVSFSWSCYLFDRSLDHSEMDVDSKLLWGGDGQKET